MEYLKISNEIKSTKNGNELLKLIENNDKIINDNNNNKNTYYIWKYAMMQMCKLNDYKNLLQLHKFMNEKIKSNNSNDNNEQLSKYHQIDIIFLNGLCHIDQTLVGYQIYCNQFKTQMNDKDKLISLNILLQGCKNRGNIVLADKIWNEFKVFVSVLCVCACV